MSSGPSYHIIKRLEVIPAQKMEFQKVASEVRNALFNQEMERRIPGYFSEVKKEAGVEILDPKYKLTSTASELVKPGN